MKTALPLLSALALALVFSFGAFAQAGALDAAFADGGIFAQDFGAQDNLTKVRVQPSDQKIVAVGTALSPAFAGQLLVVRLMPDGTPDNTFDGDGALVVTSFTESYAYDLFFQPDGKIVVVGTRADSTYNFSMLVLRLNDDGSIDTSFGINGYAEPDLSPTDDFANAVAPLPGGQMLLAGTSKDNQGINVPVVVRMNGDGSLDNTFGTAGIAALPATEIDNNFLGVGVQSDGSIIACGRMDMGLTPSGQFNHDVLVACFTADGLLDASFGNGGTVVKPISAELAETAMCMAIDPADNILLGGYTTNPDFSFDGFLMKLGTDGADATAFGTGGTVLFDHADQDLFTGIALQGDGKILAGGSSGGFFFDPRDQLLARYDASGMLDPTFGTAGYALNSVAGNFDDANALAVQADGKILLAGKGNTGANNDITIMRFMNDLGTTVQDIATRPTSCVFPNPAMAGDAVTFHPGHQITGPVRIELRDARGALVAGKPAGTNGTRVQLPSGIAPGNYSLRLLPEDGPVITAPLVIAGR